MPAALIAALCVSALLARRTALRARPGELLTCAVIGVGLMTLIGAWER